MKKLLGLVAFGAAMAVGMAQETLSRRITPEEFGRAGLGKLSPAELTALDGLFKKYGAAGDLAPSASPAPAPVMPAPPLAASKPVAAPIAPATAPGVEAEKEKPGFFRKLRRTTPVAEPKPPVETIETEIDGTFTGWEETTVWTMKDGSIWRVDNRPRPYVTSRMTNPHVRIYPALLSGFWLEFTDLNARVRVQRLK